LLGVPSLDSPTAEIKTIDATALVGAGVGRTAVGLALEPTVGVMNGSVGVGAGGLEKKLQLETRAAAASPTSAATVEGDRGMRLNGAPWRFGVARLYVGGAPGAGGHPTVWLVPDVGHAGAMGAHPAEYESRLVAFFSASVGGGSA
jgi:hypothetical protein